MKRLTSLVILIGLSTAAYAHGHQTGTASAPKSTTEYGSLEGTVTTPDGIAIWVPMNHGGIHVTGVAEDGRSKFDKPTDTTMGGLYRVDKLLPGYYDLKIRTGYVNGIAYQPQVIYAVRIKANEKTVLNIKMDQGGGLNIVGTPVYPTPAAARAQNAQGESQTATVVTASDAKPSN